MAFGDSAQQGKFMQIKTEADLAVLGDEISGKASFDSNRKRFVADPDGGFRFGVHVWDGTAVKILEGGWRLFKSIRDAVTKHGPNTMLRVTRTGEGINTDYRAEALRQLSEEEGASIAKAERWDLTKLLGWAKASPAGSEDEIPF